MSFLWRTVKTVILWKHLLQYKRAKSDAFNKTQTYRSAKWRKIPWFSTCLDLYGLMQTERSPERFLWSGCKSFIGGLILSWIFFGFCVVGFRIALKPSTWFSVFIATLLSFFISFSSVVRCYVLVLLPQVFSKRGRQALMAYAFLLAIMGPARNCTHNLAILSNSLACGQEQVKRSMRQVVEMVREPIAVVKSSLNKLKREMALIVEPIKKVVTHLTRTFSAIFGVIKSVSAWLGSIVSICNKETGTPYQRCVRSLEEATDDCKVKLGVMQFLCAMVSVVKPLCYTVKAMDMLCVLMDSVSDVIIALAKRRLATFRQHVMDLLAVSIEVEHTINMEDSSSKSVNDVISSIVTELKKRMNKIKFLFKISLVVPGFAIILLLFKVQYYRHKFLTADHFDNRYISRQMVEIDLARKRKDLDPVLPLELNERSLYTTTTSITLVKGERKRLFSALIVLIATTVQICVYLMADYGIYWTLGLIRQQGLEAAVSLETPSAVVDVKGTGTLALLYRKIENAFQPPAASIEFDPTLCLPEPVPPDFRQYVQIGVLLAVTWTVAFLEPYLLRLRNAVMTHYYPQRAKQRAIWLHNHILICRGPITTYFRNRNAKKSAQFMSIGSLFQRIAHRTKFLNKTIRACAVCAAQQNKHEDLTKCPASDCSALYCSDCIAKVLRCILCYQLIRISKRIDLLEAQDSSDENFTDIESGCEM